MAFYTASDLRKLHQATNTQKTDFHHRLLDVEYMGQEPDEPLGGELEAEMLRALRRGDDDEEEQS
jgi:hypothetical protein